MRTDDNVAMVTHRGKGMKEERRGTGEDWLCLADVLGPGDITTCPNVCVGGGGGRGWKLGGGGGLLLGLIAWSSAGAKIAGHHSQCLWSQHTDTSMFNVCGHSTLTPACSVSVVTAH